MGNTDLKHPLESFRERHILTQQQAADLVGVSQAHWNRLEKRKAWASPSLARKISDLTGVSVDFLLNWDTDSGVAR